MAKARMARFYGWTNDVIEEMDYKTFNEYMLCIEPLTAGETMSALQVSVFPNLKQDKQKKMEKDLQRQLKFNIEHQSDTPPKDTTALYNHLLRTLGNG